MSEVALFFCFNRPGSVGVTTQLIFENDTVVPDETDIKEALTEILDTSLIYLNIIRSSIVVCEYHIL